MARKEHNELAAGIFVVIALAAILGVVIWLGAAGIFHRPVQTAWFYVAEGESGGGLGKGSLLTIGGMEVGRISKVELDGEARRTYYVADIEVEGVQIHADAKAILLTGLVGDSALSIDRGAAGAPLADRKEAAVHITGGMFAQINDQLDPENKEGLLYNLNATLGNIRRQVDPSDTASLLGKIHSGVDKLNAILAAIKAEVDTAVADSMLAQAKAAVTDIRTIAAAGSKSVPAILTDVEQVAAKMRQYTEKDVADMLVTLREVSTQVLKGVGDLAAVAAKAREVVTVHRDSIDAIIDNLSMVSADLKAAGGEIRRNPWRLLRRPKDEELREQNIYDAARAFLNASEKLDQSVSKLRGLAEAHPEGIPSDDPQLVKIRQELQESFADFKDVEDALWKELNVEPPAATTQEAPK